MSLIEAIMCLDIVLFAWNDVRCSHPIPSQTQDIGFSHLVPLAVNFIRLVLLTVSQLWRKWLQQLMDCQCETNFKVAEYPLTRVEVH